jgi:hypothetical protein
MQDFLAASLLALAMTGIVSGQTAVSHANVPALEFKHPVRQTSSAWFVDYVQYAGEPAFRIRVHHYHGWCNGQLFITSTRVAYVPQFTPGSNDGVIIERALIAAATPRYAGYEIAIPQKTYAFAFLSEHDTPNVAGEPDGREELLNFVGLALSDFAAAQRKFLAALTGSTDADDGALQFAATPVVKILDPPGVTNNATADGSVPAQRVLGIAAAAKGIKAVTVNGTPATLTRLSPAIVQFTSSNLLLKEPGENPVLVAATARDDSATEFAFNLLRPDVRIIQPEAGGRISDPTVKIRGLIVGVQNLQRVDLGGKILAVSKQTDGTFVFESASIPVVMGVNHIPGFVVRADGERQLFWATVWRVPPGPPPLTLQRIEGALQADVTSGRLASLVDQNGVDFELTPEIEKRLRSIGANKTLIEAITNAKK